MKTYHTVYINGTHGNVTHLTNTTSVTTETKVCSTDVPEGLCRFFDDFKSLVQGYQLSMLHSVQVLKKHLRGYLGTLLSYVYLPEGALKRDMSNRIEAHRGGCLSRNTFCWMQMAYNQWDLTAYN